MEAGESVLARSNDRTFLGHPRGLLHLGLAESCERFSYYGMQSLLVLYMGQQLFLPGHIEHIAGFIAFRSTIDRVYGNLSPSALASIVFGLYSGGVYLTPIAGGFVADRLLGRTVTITAGAILMTIGHFLMAFEVSFLGALACLLIGVGCFRGNIASQVGELYAAGDLRRADAFQIFYMFVFAAVVVSPLVCGTLGQRVAWHWGFGAAGVGMLVGMGVYLSGRPWLPKESARKVVEASSLSRRDVKTILVLVSLLPALALSCLGNQQIFNAYIVWGEAHYNLRLFVRGLPVTWLLSLDAFLSAVTLAGVVAFWRLWSRRWKEPDEIVKITIGTGIFALAPLILALASVHEQSSGQKVSLAWALTFHLINNIAFAMVAPVGLALFSRAAPPGTAGLMIGCYYVNFFIANMIVGRIGAFLESMGPVSFWTLHASLVGIAATVFLIYSV